MVNRHSQILAILITAGALLSHTVALRGADEDRDLLIQHGIEPARDAIAKYLASLQPTAAAQQRFSELIAQLGDEDFSRREDDMLQLMRSPVYAADLLTRAAHSDDREIGYRAKLILEQADANYARILTATFRVIERQEIKGLADSILRTLPLCSNEHVFIAAQSALAATASAADIELLEQSIRAPHLETRLAAINAAAQLAYDRIRATLVELLGDGEIRVRFAAARALANHGDRQCLDALVKLLDADELSMRVKAVETLRALTGQDFAYVAYVEKEERRAATTAWRDWIAADGKTAKLFFPLKPVRVEIGRTLICLATQNKVIELDAGGKQVWEQDGLMYPWRAAGLPNGHRLVACYNGRNAFEYDARGKEVWKVEGLPGGPHSVQRLDNGNTLLACSDSHQVVEVSPDGKTVWSVTIAGRPVDARRAPNGRTLVVLQSSGQIVEVDRDGKVVWKIESLQGPNTAQPLDNGNLLVAEVNVRRVSEMTREGKVVWSIEVPTSPYDAQRVADGTTLVAESGKVSVFNQEGKKFSETVTSGDTRVTRY